MASHFGLMPCMRVEISGLIPAQAEIWSITEFPGCHCELFCHFPAHGKARMHFKIVTKRTGFNTFATNYSTHAQKRGLKFFHAQESGIKNFLA